MNILILGSGGRECTFAWKIAQSEKLSKLFIAPGNAGTMQYGTNLDINPNDFEKIKDAVISYNINLVLVGPEDPLVNGVHDFGYRPKKHVEIHNNFLVELLKSPESGRQWKHQYPFENGLHTKRHHHADNGFLNPAPVS